MYPIERFVELERILWPDTYQYDVRLSRPASADQSLGAQGLLGHAPAVRWLSSHGVTQRLEEPGESRPYLLLVAFPKAFRSPTIV